MSPPSIVYHEIWKIPTCSRDMTVQIFNYFVTTIATIARTHPTGAGTDDAAATGTPT